MGGGWKRSRSGTACDSSRIGTTAGSAYAVKATSPSGAHWARSGALNTRVSPTSRVGTAGSLLVGSAAREALYGRSVARTHTPCTRQAADQHLLEPTRGLEPLTARLQVGCATSCATS